MERKWSLDNDVFGAQLTVDEMVNAINVFEVLKKKYPNDDIIDTSIEILREEICLMFGGSIYND